MLPPGTCTKVEKTWKNLIKVKENAMRKEEEETTSQEDQSGSRKLPGRQTSKIRWFPWYLLPPDFQAQDIRARIVPGRIVDTLRGNDPVQINFSLN